MAEVFTHPGAIGIHEHYREPSHLNHSETFNSGTRAAALGGFVASGDMPNTPGHETWTTERILEKQTIITDSAIHPVMTHAGSQPESDNVGELEGLSANSLLLKLYAAATTGTHRDYETAEFKDIIDEWHRVAPQQPIGLHAGKENLKDFIHKIACDLKHPLIIHHVNSPEQVALVQEARRNDLPVWAAVCMHHIVKTSHDVLSEGWFARMQPPLASQADAGQLLHLLARGDIQIVETDHAPHDIKVKQRAEQENPEGIHDADHTTCFGVPGIEFALPLLFYQQKIGRISMERIIDATATQPAQVMGLKHDSRTRVEWDMIEYRLDEDEAYVRSGSKWTPYLGKLMVGRVREMHIGGTQIIDNTNVVGRRGHPIKVRGATI
jgi:dihydroorotase